MKSRKEMKVDAAIDKVKTYRSDASLKFVLSKKNSGELAFLYSQEASENLDYLLEAIGEAKKYGASDDVVADLWSKFYGVRVGLSDV